MDNITRQQTPNCIGKFQQRNCYRCWLGTKCRSITIVKNIDNFDLVYVENYYNSPEDSKNGFKLVPRNNYGPFIVFADLFKIKYQKIG